MRVAHGQLLPYTQLQPLLYTEPSDPEPPQTKGPHGTTADLDLSPVRRNLPKRQLPSLRTVDRGGSGTFISMASSLSRCAADLAA